MVWGLPCFSRDKDFATIEGLMQLCLLWTFEGLGEKSMMGCDNNL